MARKNKGTTRGGLKRARASTIKTATKDASPVFVEACKLAGVETTRRQQSKFYLGKGMAYKFRIQAKENVRKQHSKKDPDVKGTIKV